MVVKIAVLGAGINGLACAVKIKEKHKDYQVVIISNDFSPNTTGDEAGGLWYPYLCGRTPEHLITKWGGETYDFLHRLWLEGGHDVCLMPCYNLYRDRKNWSLPKWSKFVFGYRILNEKYLSYLSKLYSTDYAAGHVFSSFIYTSTTLLENLTKLFKSLNGVTLQMNLNSLDDPILEQFDAVVNCLGVNAKFVVPDDKVFPIRGQVSTVIAPWINETVIDEDSGHYIIPNVYKCILGGTHQEHDFNKSIDINDTEFIMDGCHNLMPSLQHARILSQWTGLRPGRDEIRLEAEKRGRQLFIHNYGHGGSGLTLFWGCATDVLQLLEKHVKNMNKCKL